MFTIFSVFYSNFEIAGKYILLTPGRRTPRRNPLEESPHGTLSALEPATEYIFLVHLNIFTNTSHIFVNKFTLAAGALAGILPVAHALRKAAISSSLMSSAICSAVFPFSSSACTHKVIVTKPLKYIIRGCPYITSAAITRQGHSECLRTLT